MKKFLCTLLLALVFSVPSFAEGGTEPLVGDVNGDGRITTADIASFIDYLLSGSEGFVVDNADVNGDGIIDVSDVAAIIDYLMTHQEAEGETFTVNGVSFTMMPVEGGTFMMGATEEQGSDYYSDERPVHEVTLSSYSIGQTEVTQELWLAVMGESISDIISRNGWSSYGIGDNYPMYDVSWDDCQLFIAELNRLTGKNFRLPTEAEWEFAARGGNKSQHYKYAGSNDIDAVAWYYSNVGSMTHPVATKAPNELGLYDMSGNVFEWCQDRYGSYSSSAQTNPTGPETGSFRVYRGGSWHSYAGYCRVSSRGLSSPSGRYYLGLRLAL